MNKKRRAAIAELAANLEPLLSAAESLRDEEQEYYDAMPESFQGGDKGQAADEAIQHLQDALDAIQQAIDSFNEIS